MSWGEVEHLVRDIYASGRIEMENFYGGGKESYVCKEYTLAVQSHGFFLARAPAPQNDENSV